MTVRARIGASYNRPPSGDDKERRHVLRVPVTPAAARATTLAWTLAPVYLVYSITGGFSIAAGALPAAMLIFVAVALTPRDVATNARPTTH